MVICSCPLLTCYEVEEVTHFFTSTLINPYGYSVYIFEISERVES